MTKNNDRELKMSSFSIRVRYVEFRISLFFFGDQMLPRAIDKLDSSPTNPWGYRAHRIHVGRGFYGLRI